MLWPRVKTRPENMVWFWPSIRMWMCAPGEGDVDVVAGDPQEAVSELPGSGPGTRLGHHRAQPAELGELGPTPGAVEEVALQPFPRRGRQRLIEQGREQLPARTAGAHHARSGPVPLSVDTPR